MNTANIIQSLGQEIEQVISSPDKYNWMTTAKQLAKKIELITKLIKPSEGRDLFFKIQFKTDIKTLISSAAHKEMDYNYKRHKLMTPEDNVVVEWSIFDMLIYAQSLYSDLLNFSTDIEKTISTLASFQSKDKIGQAEIEGAFARAIKILQATTSDKTSSALDIILRLSINGHIELEMGGFVKTSLIEYISKNANANSYKVTFEPWWRGLIAKASLDEIFSVYSEVFCPGNKDNFFMQSFKGIIGDSLKEKIKASPKESIGTEVMGKIIKTRLAVAASFLEDEITLHYLNLYSHGLTAQSEEKKLYNSFILYGVNPAIHNIGKIGLNKISIEGDEFTHLVNVGLFLKALNYKLINFKLSLEQAQYVLEHKNVNQFFKGQSLDLFMKEIKAIENSHTLAPHLLNLHASDETAKHYEWVASSIEKMGLEVTIEEKPMTANPLPAFPNKI